MKSKLFISAKEEPSAQEVQNLIRFAAKLEPELITIVRMADEAGIYPGITRFMKWEFLDGDYILLKHHNSEFPRRRRLPKALLKYLNGLKRNGPYICPRLSVHKNIGNLYKSLWRTIPCKVSAQSLVWRWDREHEKERNMEEVHAHLERLASEFLTQAQFIGIQMSMQIMQRLPPTKQCHRRRNREEILADF